MGMKLSGYFYADNCEVESNGCLCLTFETSKHDQVFVDGLEIGYHLSRDGAIELATDLLEHHGIVYHLLMDAEDDDA